jgi:hypothetical protein
MARKRHLEIPTFLIFIFILSCGGGPMNPETLTSGKVSQIQSESLENLSRKTIFFGHQSVGNNIIQGLFSLKNDYPKIRLEVSDYSGDINDGTLLHAPIGRNMDPESKIHGFVEYMRNGIGNKVSIAFFKFCYVDVTAATDVDKLFRSYQEAMDKLAVQYPQTHILHTTIPLTVVQTGPRAWVKKVIGKPVGGYEDNIKRNRFNELMRKTYEAKTLFDLAAVETVYPDGRLNQFSKGGRKYDALVPEYASDGRHLNNTGSRLAAADMLLSISRTLSGKTD